MTDVVVSFAAKDHDKLVNAFKQVAKAQQDFVKANNKAAQEIKKSDQGLDVFKSKVMQSQQELRKLLPALRDSGKSFKQLGLNLETVRAAAQGNAQALGLVRKAAMNVAGASAVASTGMFDLSNNGRLLHNTFATLRGQLLLVAFAMNLISGLVMRQVEAYAKQEASLLSLVLQFGEGARTLQAWSKEMQKATRFGDENINQVLALAGAYGANEEEAKKLTKATMNLAEGMQKDLLSTAEMVMKTWGTNTDALTRYIGASEGAAGSTEKLASIVDNINSKFDGFAEKMANTVQGRLDQFKNSVGDLQERIGQVLSPKVMILTSLFKFLADSVPIEILQLLVNTVIIGGTSLLIYVNRAKLVALWNGIMAASAAIYTAAQAAATLGLKAFFYTLKVETGGVWLLITALGTLIVTLYEWFAGTDAVKTDMEKVNELLQDFTTLTGAQRDEIAKTAKGNQTLATAIASNTEQLNKQIGVLKAKINFSGKNRAVMMAEAEAGRKLLEVEKKLVKELYDLQLQWDAHNDLISKNKRKMEALESAYNQTREGQRQAVKELLDWARSQNNLTEDAIKGVKLLNQQWADLLGSDLGDRMDDTIEKMIQQKNILLEQDPVTKKALQLGYSYNEMQEDTFLITRLAIREFLNEKKAVEDLNAEKSRMEKAVKGTHRAQLQAAKSQLNWIQQNEAGFKSWEVWSEAIDNAKQAIEDIEDAQKRQKRATEEASSATIMSKNALSQAKSESRIADWGMDWTNPIASLKDYTNEIRFNAQLQKGALIERTSLNESLLKQDLISQTEYNNEKASILNDETALLIEQQEAQREVRRQTAEMAMETFNQITGHFKQNVEQEAKDKMESLKKSDKYISASNEEKKQMESDVNASMAKKRKRVFAMEQAAKVANVAMSTGEAIMGAIAAFPVTMGQPWAGLIAAMGAIQTGMILSQKPPKYAKGGYVGGKLHSQGGTLIEAEAGEYVVSRRAVNDIGVRNLNRMNETGSAGEININVSGNILTQDFVEGELADSIREAIRRGSNFGIG